uniref:START domain-containing protein n=1 Tax=Macrostomum lignano TaxID=282301 RepID=A0A1I8FR11_9PLAT
RYRSLPYGGSPATARRHKKTSTETRGEKPDGVDGSIESAAAERCLRSFRLLNSEKATERQLRHIRRAPAASFDWSSFARSTDRVCSCATRRLPRLTAPQMQEARGGACRRSGARNFPVGPAGRARVAALKSRLDANPGRGRFCQLSAVRSGGCGEVVPQRAARRLSPTLMDIFTYVKSEDARLLAMQASMLLLPDENREVLQALLYFLNDFADCAENNRRWARRTSPSAWRPRCSTFHTRPLPGRHWRSRDAVSPRRLRRATEQNVYRACPTLATLDRDHRAATACLTFMIESCHQLFMLPDSIHSKPQSKQSKQLEQETQLHQSKHPPLSLDSVAPRDSSGRRHCFAFADNHAQLLARECGETAAVAGKWRQFSLRSGVETFSRSVADGHPLRMWKAVMGIDADPGDVLNKIIAERPSWDPDILSAHTVEAIDDSAEVVRFGVASPPAQPAREACLLRTWRSDSASSHRLHSVSVQLQPSHQTMQIHVLTEDWLLERVSGAGRSSSPRCRVTLLSRVDLRGRSIDWYNRIWGHSIARALSVSL